MDDHAARLATARTREPRLVSIIVPPGRWAWCYASVHVPAMLDDHVRLATSDEDRLFWEQARSLVRGSMATADAAMVARGGIRVHVGMTDDGEWLHRVKLRPYADHIDSSVAVVDTRFHGLGDEPVA